MILKDYLYFNDILIKDFAATMGYTPIYMGMVVKGTTKVTLKLAKAIEFHTAGKVTAEEVMSYKKQKKRSIRKVIENAEIQAS